MDTLTQKIYDTVYGNAVLFLRRGIKETIHSKVFDREAGIVSCLFVQMSVELALKAYLIKRDSVYAILDDKMQQKDISAIFAKFEADTLHTKRFQDLKLALVARNFNWLTDKHIQHFDAFQKRRNKLVHLNLSLDDPQELSDLKLGLIYVVVHVLVPLLAEISFDYQTPSEFYEENLDKKDYLKLIDFLPYIKEMEKLAKEYSLYVYPCPDCHKKTFSTAAEICYCCNLSFVNAGEYTDCKNCDSRHAVLFDHLNIGLHDNIMNGLCLNCEDRPQVFKCPECEATTTFYGKPELNGTCYEGCLN
jgi:hypothetical protein